MKLHKAIEQLIMEQGKNLLFNDAFVNALSDYNAFNDNPAYKNILKIICKEGYLKTFNDKGTWQMKADRTIFAICQDYCWPTTIIKYLFDSIAYGLKFTLLEPIMLDNVKDLNATSHEFSLSYKKLKEMPKERFNLYKVNTEQYLDSILVKKNNWDFLGSKMKVSTEFYLDDVDAESVFHVTVVLDGKITGQYKYAPRLNVYVCNSAGKPVFSGYSWHFLDNDKEWQVIESVKVGESQFKHISDIKEIIVFWDGYN